LFWPETGTIDPSPDPAYLRSGGPLFPPTNSSFGSITRRRRSRVGSRHCEASSDQLEVERGNHHQSEWGDSTACRVVTALQHWTGPNCGRCPCTAGIQCVDGVLAASTNLSFSPAIIDLLFGPIPESHVPTEERWGRPSCLSNGDSQNRKSVRRSRGPGGKRHQPIVDRMERADLCRRAGYTSSPPLSS
jgi:hypothetical protein